jgi:hypothetical protein
VHLENEVQVDPGEAEALLNLIDCSSTKRTLRGMTGSNE